MVLGQECGSHQRQKLTHVDTAALSITALIETARCDTATTQLEEENITEYSNVELTSDAAIDELSEMEAAPKDGTQSTPQVKWHLKVIYTCLSVKDCSMSCKLRVSCAPCLFLF